MFARRLFILAAVGAFHLLDEFRDIVEGKPRLEITEIAGRDLEGLSPGGLANPRRSVSLTISRNGRPVWRGCAFSWAATSSSKVRVVRMS
jgi:hypothetical protein